AIITTVDLQTKKILKVATHKHLPTPLAQEEADQAEYLALRNKEVKNALGRLVDDKGKLDKKIVVHAMASQPGEGDALFGRRLAVLLFQYRDTGGYLIS